jgi:hypothetical protein
MFERTCIIQFFQLYVVSYPEKNVFWLIEPFTFQVLLGIFHTPDPFRMSGAKSLEWRVFELHTLSGYPEVLTHQRKEHLKMVQNDHGRVVPTACSTRVIFSKIL